MDKILEGKNVLVVDDMGALRVLISGLLRGAGVNVIEAASGEQAISITDLQSIDAFILDIHMPGMDGIALCRILRSMERHKNTPVMFISSMDETRALEDALAAGGDDFIGKPIHFVVLRARLRNLLQRSAFLNQERMMSLSLQRYVSPRTEEIARIYAQSGVLPAPKRQEVCILFSDVRGFTELSNEMEPEVLLNVLSGHLETLVSLVYRHGGYVDKFSGDGLMAVFDGEDMVFKCCRCALEMLDSSRERLASEGIRIHQMGIGINKGEAVIGNLGSSEHLDYTLIGKTVNLAARLCSMAHSLSIVVSQSVRDELLGSSALGFANQRMATVRGFRDPISIYDLTRA
ncbi:MAG: adenylate/guanylate cyclase domain-containing protein [Burkholderiales bacterium]